MLDLRLHHRNLQTPCSEFATTPLITAETQGEGPEIESKAPSGTIESMSDIVIYEEDHAMRALLCEWLSAAGYRVRMGPPRNAQSGRADLVIVNVYMPKQQGAQWVGEIQAAHPRTPLIAISSQFRSGLSDAGAAAQALGVRQVIAKPLARTDLLEVVRAMIGAPS
jgi:DNA-binding response OmpR family regulator